MFNQLYRLLFDQSVRGVMGWPPPQKKKLACCHHTVQLPMLNVWSEGAGENEERQRRKWEKQSKIEWEGATLILIFIPEDPSFPVRMPRGHLACSHDTGDTRVVYPNWGGFWVIPCVLAAFMTSPVNKNLHGPEWPNHDVYPPDTQTSSTDQPLPAEVVFKHPSIFY